jgi:uncharacterized pyridoxamine 5'-phosphate oxidase family protein
MGIPTAEEVLKLNPVVYLATSEENQPRVRPVSLIVDKGDLFILTGSEDAKIAQIKQNNRVEVVTPVKADDHTGYVRFSAKAVIETRQEYRRRAAKAAPFFSNYWDSPDHPKYALIRLEPEKIEYLLPGKMYPDRIEILEL